MYRKGQTLSYDFFVSMTMFIIALTIILFYWTYSSKQIDETVAKNYISNKLFLASQVWFMEGYPKYWNPSTVLSIGLVNDGYINSTKMNYLPTIVYQKFISITGIQSYNIYYRVYNESNSALFEFCLYPSGEKNLLKISRLSVLDSVPVVIDTLVWR